MCIYTLFAVACLGVIVQAGARRPPDDAGAAGEGFEPSKCVDGCILATKLIANVCHLQDKCMSGQQANRSWEFSLDGVKSDFRIGTKAS